jgi:16S rRNA (guanine527-N7)-methyltransferase
MTPRDLLITGAKELGVELSAGQIDSIFLYLDELKKWNRKINLTAIRDDRDVVIKHVLDSLSYIKGLPSPSGQRLLDMGSGAGFPAIPIKLVLPELSVTMVEAVKKKGSFLRHMIRTLKLSEIDVQDRRTEELPDSFKMSYDIVTARAFADMAVAVKTGLPFLKAGGVMVLSRGPEEAIDEQELAGFGIELKNKIELTLPLSDYRRAIWIWKRIQ